ncbi:hypothetical protein PVL29_024708 [Vitis rotundifolia]|uniref:Uncharacterized protein n=1 Tax=Vitis rotundifolia TaxID=103349 RepID=A0AA38YSN2_VITRO|nr:hypothetical protein PVL29_024708 [Vitis rotundifolia]
MGKISLDYNNHNDNRNLAASTSNGFRIGLSMRSCTDSNKKRVDRNGHQAFAYSYQQQVLRDFEIGLPDAGLPTGHGASHHGKLLGFPLRSLPEKIVVVVDVDEFRNSMYTNSSRHGIVHEIDEADIRVHELFKTSYFKTGIHPIPGSWEQRF